MDVLTLAMAKKYTDDQRLGYTELSPDSIKWDGNTEGLQVLDGTLIETEGSFYRVTGKVLTPEMVRSIYCDTGDVRRFKVANISVTDEDAATLYRGTILVNNGDNAVIPNTQLLAIALKENLSPELRAGTYFFKGIVRNLATVYVSEMYGNMNETIHPIDPKFLPDTVATKADIFGAMEASY